MKKLIVPIIVFVVALGAIFLRIGTIRGQEDNRRTGIEVLQRQEGYPVRLVTVEQKRLEVFREIHGKIAGYKEAHIATSDAARVASIKYRVGDRVAADMPIITLDENDPKNMSQVKLLRSVYENALKDYERYSNLYASGGVSKDVVDKMELQLKSAKTNLDSARSTVQLTSPIDGILVALYARVGENAEPDKTLAIVAVLDRIRIITAVSDRDIADFAVGQTVSVVLPSGEARTGSVDRISIAANPDTGLFDLEAVIPNEDQLFRVGSFISITIRTVDLPDVVQIDSNAILRDFDGSDYVWLNDEGKARKMPISVIRTNNSMSQIEGLKPGDAVVIKGKSLLYEDAPLQILDEGLK